jgi:subtilisin family serine protease
MQRIRPAHLLGGLGVVLSGIMAGCSDEQPVGPTSAAVRPALAVSAPSTRPDRYLVSFKTTEPASFAATVQALGGTVDRRHRSIKIAVVSGIGSAGAASLATNPGVTSVLQDLDVQYISPPSAPQLQDFSGPIVTPSGTDQSGAFFYGFQWNMRQVAANQAWSVTPGGAGQVVCVLDTGIDPDHLDIAGKVDLTKIASFISSPLFSGDLDPIDYNSHGTASAGYITSNGFGMASVAPDAKLCAGKVLNVLGSGSFADVIAGILWASEIVRANVINMSLGGYLDKNIPGAQGLVAALELAVGVANKRGTVVVASAGNAALDLDHDPANFMELPAQIKGVISVGATAPFNQQNFDNLASYSNFGGKTGIKLVAPGGDLLPGGNTFDLVLSACSEYQLVLSFACGPNSYLLAAGTSESAPHVSGAAAVIRSAHPGLTPAGVTSCILKGVDVVGPTRIFGAGRLNVLKAATGC